MFAKSFKQDAGLNSLSGIVDFSQATGGFALPQGTTAQRPLNPVAGTTRINTTLNVVEMYTGTTWQSLTKLAYQIDYLIVAGGGGGGQTIGGGGGGGGVLTGSTTLVPGTVYSFTVGAGGAGDPANAATYPTSAGTTGGSSLAFGQTALGGGGGGGYNNTTNAVKNGGSGGGMGAGTTGNVAIGSANQGYAGGQSSGNTNSGAGGGGAGAVGGSGVSGTAGNGGAGVASSITGTTTFYGGVEVVEPELLAAEVEA